MDLDRLIDFYNRFAPDSVARFPEFYSADAWFKDPFNEVRGIAVIRQAEGLAAEQATQAEHPREARIQADHMALLAPLGEAAHMGRVVRMIHEGAEEHPMPPRQLTQDVEGPDLVALVGRKRNAMNQVEQRAAVVCHRAHPRLRTMCGPIVLATASGRRRHMAMKARYLGLSGLFWGTSSRL